MNLEDWVSRGWSVALARQMLRIHDERVKQVTIGAGLLIGLTLLISGLLLGWRYLPGLLGEWVGTILGVMTTPFLLEGSFLAIGLLIVLCFNIWHRHKEGDDFVYLEQVTGPDVPMDLPEQAKWAMYREKPLDPEEPTALMQAEGAFAIGDYPAATEWIGTLDQEDLKRPETLELRLKLARATGRHDLASDLERAICNLAPPPDEPLNTTRFSPSHDVPKVDKTGSSEP